MEKMHTVWGKHPHLPFYVSIDGEVASSEKRGYFDEWHKYTAHRTHYGEGYPRITISRNNKKTQHTIHRLVIETFKGAIPKHMQVDHINEVKTDNRLENLQLLTPSENTLKSARIGELNGRATITKDTAQAIYDASIEYRANPGFRFTGYKRHYKRDLAKRFGTTEKIVSKILRGETWQNINRHSG
jgi:hypothetical protein